MTDDRRTRQLEQLQPTGYIIVSPERGYFQTIGPGGAIIWSQEQSDAFILHHRDTAEVWAREMCESGQRCEAVEVHR